MTNSNAAEGAGPVAVIADDDPVFRALAASKLAQVGFAVHEAGDGVEAWSVIRKCEPALALVDLEMPGMKGHELITCVRGHPRTAHLPIVVITSRNDADAVSESLDAGATAFLTKPVNWTMFGNHLKSLLMLNGLIEEGRRAAAAAARTLETASGLADELSRELGLVNERLAIGVRDALASRGTRAAEDGITLAVEEGVREIERARVKVGSFKARLDQGDGPKTATEQGTRRPPKVA